MQNVDLRCDKRLIARFAHYWRQLKKGSAEKQLLLHVFPLATYCVLVLRMLINGARRQVME